MTGKSRKLSRVFRGDGNTIVVPVDDSLIFGPFAGLHNIKSKINDIAAGNPDAILAHFGTFCFDVDISMNSIGRIINISASTVNSNHTKKIIISSLDRAIRYDADCVAVHLNISSKFESEMLFDFGKIVSDAEVLGLPVMAIVYPRCESSDGSDNNYTKLKESSINDYARLVCHCVRIARDLGADIIKTQYTGCPETFIKVVEAASPVPVIIAGGELVDIKDILQVAESAIRCGGKGVSFGRNIFSRTDSTSTIKCVASIVHEGYTSKNAFNKYFLESERSDSC